LSDTPTLDAQVLLAHVLGVSRAWVLAHPDASLSPEEQLGLEEGMGRLEAGELLPYVLGHWEFYGLDFTLTPATLIPRPETELLVEQALDWLGAHPQCLAADVGAGSGCIAVALAAHHPGLQVIATDISLPALRVAQQNAAKHEILERVWPVQCDLLPAISRPLDLICANLPYIPIETLRSLRLARREPELALSGGLDGLALIRRLLALAPRHLAPGGLLLMEIEATQGGAARTLAQSAFPQARVELLPDLAGHDRLIRIETAV